MTISKAEQIENLKNLVAKEWRLAIINSSKITKTRKGSINILGRALVNLTDNLIKLGKLGAISAQSLKDIEEIRLKLNNPAFKKYNAELNYTGKKPLSYTSSPASNIALEKNVRRTFSILAPIMAVAAIKTAKHPFPSISSAAAALTSLGLTAGVGLKRMREKRELKKEITNLRRKI